MSTNSLRSAMLVAVVIAGGLFTSCKKEKAAANCTVTTANISGTYKLVSMKYKASPTSPDQDYLVLMEACEKDDLVTLAANGSYTYKDAGTVCTPNGDDNGTWSVNGNTITSDGTVNGTITSFDCSTLSFYTSNLNVAGDKLSITMKKQ